MATWGTVTAWFICDGYLYDWLAAGAAIIINLAVPPAIEPVDRFYTSGDPTLSYPLNHGTISSALLYVLTFVFPGVVFVAYAVWRRSFAEGHHALLCLAEGFALATGWKRWMNLVGRYRPNWFAVLLANDSKETDDAKLSYPSGHCAYMFFSGTILTCWLLGKTKVMAVPSQALFAKLLACLIPLYLATFVACTRITDYKHDFSDVNAGCFIGLSTGLVAYFLNYPSLLSLQCHVPKLRTRLSPLTSDLAVTPHQKSGWAQEEQQHALGGGCSPAPRVEMM